MVSRARSFHPIRLLRQIYLSPKFLGERYSVEDNTQVTLFTDQPGQFPGYCPVKSLTGSSKVRHISVSLVVTARNERDTVRLLFESILHQSRLPDEIVAIDTGSEDGTLEVLQELASKSTIPFQVLEKKGANIAKGRNYAIHMANSEVIAVTDFGCKLSPNWLESLISPFEIDPAIQVSAGRYQAIDGSGRSVRWLLGRTLNMIEPQSYLPASNSIAFTKEAWERAGRYPEWLSMTGEDTYFDLELKRTTKHWAFVPEAVVAWESPQRLVDIWRKSYRWSIGDGEAGMTSRSYRWLILQFGSLGIAIAGCLILLLFSILSGSLLLQGLAGLVILALVGWFFTRLRKSRLSFYGLLLRLGTNIAQIAGYLEGLRHRQRVDPLREATLRGTVIILSGVPIDDTGGGGRWTQIALELIRRHYLVQFIYKFPKYERVDLRLNIRHPNLFCTPLNSFRWKNFEKSHTAILNGKPLLALVEFPSEEFLPILQEVRQNGGQVIYDRLDDWATSLGGNWYSEAGERRVVDTSHVLTATALPLQERLEYLSGRKVSFVPNAVNSYLFRTDRCFAPPPDLPSGTWRAIYIGALWGEWFDWELLIRVARTYPDAAILVIGDYAGQCSDAPPNLHFLGLKPQKDLPAYLAHSDIALIPWKVTPITRATSPLKVYEYIAMLKPVIAPDIPPLTGLPGVILAKDPSDFIEKVGSAIHQKLNVAEAAQFIKANDWQARVTQLLTLACPGEKEQERGGNA